MGKILRNSEFPGDSRSGAPSGGKTLAAKRIVPKVMFDASEEARALISDAERKARELEEDALAAAEKSRKQAILEGREQGLAEVTRELVAARALRQKSLREAEREIMEVAVAIAKKILGEELQLDPARVRAIVARVLEEVRNARRLVLHVHPDDVPWVRDIATREGTEMAIFEEPSMTRGGCIVKTEQGELDARIEIQLNTLRTALLGHLSDESHTSPKL